MTKPNSMTAKTKVESLNLQLAVKALFNAKLDFDLASAAEAMMVGGFSRATLHRRVNDGSFPAPVYPTPGAARWVVGDLRRWLKATAKNTVRPAGVGGRVQAAVKAAKDRRAAHA